MLREEGSWYEELFSLKIAGGARIEKFFLTENIKRGCHVKALFTKNMKWNPANVYLFKFNNKNTRKSCKLCLKLIIKTPERRRQNQFSNTNTFPELLSMEMHLLDY